MLFVKSVQHNQTGFLKRFLLRKKKERMNPLPKRPKAMN